MEIRSNADGLSIQDRSGPIKQSDAQEFEAVKKTSSNKAEVELQQEKTYTKAEVSKEMGHLNKLLESKNAHLHFILHDKLNEYYVQLVDDQTNEVVREIPSKRVMDMVANFYEKLGIIVDKKI